MVQSEKIFSETTPLRNAKELWEGRTLSGIPFTNMYADAAMKLGSIYWLVPDSDKSILISVLGSWFWIRSRKMQLHILQQIKVSS